jgi:hypothetical protein
LGLSGQLFDPTQILAGKSAATTFPGGSVW